MTTQEHVGFLVFVAIVVTTLVAAASILARIAVDRLRGISRPPSPGRRRYRAVVLSLAGLGLLAAAYGAFVEPYWPEVTHVRVASARMRPGARVRVVHLSDLHSDPTVRLEERLPALVAAQHPDLIVFSGDAANSPEGVPTFKRCLASLAGIAPVYVVRGNWDNSYSGRGEPFAGTGAVELDGNSVLIDVRGQPVRIAGAGVHASPMEDPEPDDEVARLLAALPGTAPTVFVHHYPDRVLDAAASGVVDVFCAGHTHGGQIALPFYGALITLARFGKRFEGGTYVVGPTTLHVNRGIGMEGGPAPRVRFWARPEITVIDLVGARE